MFTNTWFSSDDPFIRDLLALLTTPQMEKTLSLGVDVAGTPNHSWANFATVGYFALFPFHQSIGSNFGSINLLWTSEAMIWFLRSVSQARDARLKHGKKHFFCECLRYSKALLATCYSWQDVTPSWHWHHATKQRKWLLSFRSRIISGRFCSLSGPSEFRGPVTMLFTRETIKQLLAVEKSIMRSVGIGL